MVIMMKKEAWIMLLLFVLMSLFLIITSASTSEEELGKSQYVRDRASETINHIQEIKKDIYDRKELLINRTTPKRSVARCCHTNSICSWRHFDCGESKWLQKHSRGDKLS